MGGQVSGGHRRCFHEEPAALAAAMRRPMTSEIEETSVDPSSTREGYFEPPSGATDERLHELEIRYRGIIDQLPAVLYVDRVNEDEPMIDVSPSVVDLLGVSREQFLSRPY